MNEQRYIDEGTFNRQLENASPGACSMHLLRYNGHPIISHNTLALTKWFELVGEYLRGRVRYTQGPQEVKMPSLSRGIQKQYVQNSMLYNNSDLYREDTLEYARAERLDLRRMLQLAGKTVTVEWVPDRIGTYVDDYDGTLYENVVIEGAHWVLTYDRSQLESI